MGGKRQELGPQPPWPFKTPQPFDSGIPTLPLIVFSRQGKWVRRGDSVTGRTPPLPRDWLVHNPPNTPENTNRKGPFCGQTKSAGQGNKKRGSSSGEGVCLRSAGEGTAHKGYGPCYLHGGTLPEVSKKFIKIMEENLMATYGQPREVDPHAAVLEEVHRTAGHVAWLFDKIQQLGEDVEAKSLGDQTLHQFTSMGLKASVWVEMYQTERAHLLKASKSAVDMGVSERQVQLAEEQGRMIAMIMQQFIDSQEIGLTPAQRAVAPKVIRRLLTAMPTKQPEALPPPTLEIVEMNGQLPTDDEEDEDEFEEF
jgi:hypothetical protein